MSCMDNLIDTVTDGIAFAVKNIIKVGVIGVKAAVTGIGNGVRAAVNGLAWIATKLGDAFDNIVEQHKISEEVKRTQAYEKLRRMRALQKLSFKKIAERHDNAMTNDHMTAEEVDRLIEALTGEITELESVREYVYPDGLYEEIKALSSLDVFDMDESRLEETRQMLSSITDRLQIIGEQGIAVMCSVAGKEYEPEEERQITADEVQNAFTELINTYREFESKMPCKNKLAEIGIKIEVAPEFVTIEKEGDAGLICNKLQEKV